MKNNLLFGAALLMTISAAAQQRCRPVAGLSDIAREKYMIAGTEPSGSISQGASTAPMVSVPNGKTSKAASLNINWNAVTKSMNVLGCLVTEQRPVWYEKTLDAVSLIVRRGPHYTMSPAPTSTGGISGGIIAYVTPDWGGSWDSTLVWNNSTNWARYPQGGIYNPSPSTNTVLANAYVVVTGPTTSNANGWVGSYFASKPLSTYDNTASTTSGAQQWFSSNSTYAPFDANVKKVDMARLNFDIPDDGVVRALGSIVNDYNFDANNTMWGFRGARLVKGTFNAGVFTWTSDSISLVTSQVEYDAQNLQYNVLDGYNSMAWSESGQVGYLWFLGFRDTALVKKNNRGLQPIIWKTTNAGSSWSLMPPIDFNDSITFKPVLDNITRVQYPLNERDQRIPYFNSADDISGVVDKNNNLHLVTTLWSTRKSHVDSLGFIWTYTNVLGDGQTYRYKHSGGFENWIYDFSTVAAGTSWSVTLVDTLETEYCGTGTSLGNGANPYTDTKYQVGARIQAARSPNGEYIIYNWADSKYVFTDNALHWNNKPDLYARARPVDSAHVFRDKYDLTGFAQAGDIYSHAYMHYASPKAKVTGSPISFTVSLPLKVCSSNPLVGDGPNTHYYGTAVMSFTSSIFLGVSENAAVVASSMLYPNPAREKCNVGINLKNNSNVGISVFNIVGQEVKALSVKGITGENQIEIDLNGLSSGIYMVNIKVDNASVTKKLVVE